MVESRGPCHADWHTQLFERCAGVFRCCCCPAPHVCVFAARDVWTLVSSALHPSVAGPPEEPTDHTRHSWPPRPRPHFLTSYCSFSRFGQPVPSLAAGLRLPSGAGTSSSVGATCGTTEAMKISTSLVTNT